LTKMKDGGTEEDVASRIKKANGVFVQMYPVWRNHNISKGVKIRIFNTNVKSVLLYDCETWTTTNWITKRLQIFLNKCLRQITNIKWTNKITNEELWSHQTEANRNSDKKKKMELDWTHITHRSRSNRENALDWNPQGYRRRGRLKRTWQRTTEDAIRSTGTRSRE